MWSGVMFSTTATSAWNVSMSSSWKLDSSATTHASGSIRPGSSVSARPTLPATSTGSPPARSIAPISSVVVVLPLVPVTPTNGLDSIRCASSTSPHTGTPAARAARTTGASPGTPGLLISAVSPATGTSSCPVTYSTPIASSLAVSRPVPESKPRTPAPGHSRWIASHDASPERRRPTTR